MDEVTLNNVKEDWVMYDTVLIGKNVPANFYPNASYYQTFAELALANEISFFNMRNRSMVGESYCNQDSIDKMTWPFEVKSIGVSFFAFPMFGKDGSSGIEGGFETDGQEENNGLLMFLGQMVNHCAMILKVNQDEKSVLNCAMAPSGYGLVGSAVPDVGHNQPFGQFVGMSSNWSSGNKRIKNRFKFPEPVEIPRGQTISVKLEFSSIGKQLLSVMSGPGNITTESDELDNTVGVYTQLPQVCGIRVSLMGHRYVQQRGQLHV